LSGITVTNTTQTIDNLTYTYKNSGKENQLLKVEDAALTAGFNNGTVNGSAEYTYSSDGSMTKDDNKGISTILYNALGKPRQVTFTDGRTIAYTYAADGSKLKMVVTITTPASVTTTDYANGFVYTNNALSFFGSPEGRVVKNGSTYEQQYAIADHQGNTRVLFTSVAPAPYIPQATWEGDANDNQSQFRNVVASTVVSFTAANHTTGGSKVVRMNQTYKIGPAKDVAVYPGDKIDIEVWEYHEGNSGFGTTSTPIATLITNVAGVFGGVAGAPDVSGAIYNGVNSAVTGFGTGGNQGNARPAAYLNYILFDKNYKVLNAGWQLAPLTTFTKQKLSFATINVKEAGYVFAWLSYDDDSNNWVYFDDFKVTHTKYNNVIQYNEYYAFGMQTAGSWTRENVTANNYLANGGTEFNATSMLYDLDYRNYDPVLGRMNQVDPMAGKYASLSPYNFSFNNPVSFADPNGADPSPGEPDYVASWERYLGRVAHTNPGYGAGVLRPFGVSMSFGLLSYSPFLQQQMKADAESMPSWDYAAKYGEKNVLDYIGNVTFRFDGKLLGGYTYYAGGKLGAMALVEVEEHKTGDRKGGFTAIPGPIEVIEFGIGEEVYQDDLYSQSLRATQAILGFAQFALETTANAAKPLYTGPGDWIALTGRASRLGSKLGLLGTAISAADGMTHGWKRHHTADVAIGLTLTGASYLATSAAVSMAIPGVNVVVATVGITYFAVDLAVQILRDDHKSLTQIWFD
jgi:RHS repeat-associated protein